VKAVRDVSFEVEDGELLGLIGPNGSGKSTLFNLVVGTHKPTSGEVYAHGERIDRHSAAWIARRGIVRTFQARSLFEKRTVRENVELARLFAHSDVAVDEALDSVGLLPRANRIAATVPTADARRLAIAMAVAAKPKILLLDEPGAGLAPNELEELGRLLIMIKKQLDATMWVIDHDMGFLLGLVERVIVMDSGEVIADGSPDDVRRNEQVRRVYLGHR
jgi:branched-chain amino acid transport system ATP-binding protein